MKTIAKVLLHTFLVLTSFESFSQKIDTTFSARHLVEQVFLGTGVVAGNVTFRGAKHTIAQFNDSTEELGINEGILLTSGNAFYALGPNKSPRTGWASNTEGDEELSKIARGDTYDASVLSFDFITASENLSFEFVFASEEYLEYVGSKFNDVFAFFITTPDGEKINIARLPDGKTPITVNTVNNRLNSKYYVDNTYLNTTDPFIWDVRNRKVIANENYGDEERPTPYNTQFDGFTTVLQARAKVIPNKLYKIKIAIADVGDGILDSGVYLKGKSFKSDGEIKVEILSQFSKPQQPAPEPLANKAGERQEPLPEQVAPLLTQISIDNIEFEFDKYTLTSEGLLRIEALVSKWKKKPNITILLNGHTDSFGSIEYNETLSKLRVNTVADALKRRGIPEGNIKVDSFGELKPIKDNSTSFGRARNRRVEVVLIH